MIKESLTDTFDTAEGEIVADNVSTAPPAEQVALNFHGIATRIMSISPEAAVGICNAAGQMSCLLSSTEIPEDSLKEQFRVSVNDVQAVESAQPDHLKGLPIGAIPQQRTFG